MPNKRITEELLELIESKDPRPRRQPLEDPGAETATRAGMSAAPAAAKPRGKKASGKAEQPFELRSSAELSAEAAQREADADAKEAGIADVMSSSLERMVGNALMSRVGTGSKEDMKNLLREIDKNGDGAVQNIELRQLIRNELKLSASNKEIDQLFKKFDQDGSGSIDFQEWTLVTAEAAQDAKEEIDTRYRIDQMRARAAERREAAEAMREYEEAERVVAAKYVDEIAATTSARSTPRTSASQKPRCGSGAGVDRAAAPAAERRKHRAPKGSAKQKPPREESFLRRRASFISSAVGHVSYAAQAITAPRRDSKHGGRRGHPPTRRLRRSTPTARAHCRIQRSRQSSRAPAAHRSPTRRSIR